MLFVEQLLTSFEHTCKPIDQHCVEHQATVFDHNNNFNFIMHQNKGYKHNRVILSFPHQMLDEEAFSKWCILNWETKGISLNLYWGLGSKYSFFLFNYDVVVGMCFSMALGILHAF